VPLDGARSATGKLLMMNFFIIVPLLNFTYWFLLWARRRTLALGKMPTTERGAALLSPQPVPAGRRWLFEHSADYRDLRLDGRHWQAQFGGASRPNDEPVGAYVCCNSVAFAVTRFLFALVACLLLEARIFQFWNAYPDRWWCLFLYMQDWMLMLACIYLVLVCVLTARATCLQGAVAHSTPAFVWIAWALNGMLLPFALCVALLYPCLGASAGANAYDDFRDPAVVFEWVCVYGTFALLYLDAFLNRQPYYASFHGFLGVGFCWSYLLLLILYPLLGGTNEQNQPFIYEQWPQSAWSSLGQVFTAAKVVTVEVFLFVPTLHALYWCSIWSIRRARVAARKLMTS